MTIEPRKHPAVIIERFAQIVHEYFAACIQVRVLDPFAGIDGIHKIPELLQGYDVDVVTVGIDLQSKWAAAHTGTYVGDATALPERWTHHFEVIMTSPWLEDGNAGTLQWTNHEYKNLHVAAWSEAYRVLKPGGIFVVNISNHIRGGKEMPVVEWHLEALLELGLYVERVEQIPTPRMRMGANAHARVAHEAIIIMRKSL